MLLFIFEACAIFIKLESNSKFLKVVGNDLKTTSNLSDAEKFTFDEMNKDKSEYIIAATNNKVIDNTGINRPGNIIMWGRHGKQNQIWKAIPSGKGYKFLTLDLRLSYNEEKDSFATVKGQGEKDEDVFLLVKENGFTLTKINQEQTAISEENEDEENIDSSLLKQGRHARNKKTEDIPEEEPKEPKESKSKGNTINLFLVQMSEGGPGLLGQYPLLPNHSAFSGNRFIFDNGMICNNFLTPNENQCHIKKGNHGIPLYDRQRDFYY